jgi:ubiquinone/menaquinone biosynthesis C-methylase UbiE
MPVVSQSDMKAAGTRETQRFYNETGWKQEDGAPVDLKLFGYKENGPIRVELHRLSEDRIVGAISKAGLRLSVLECGCGGNPGTSVLDLCSRYTGVDFSHTGIQLARASFAGVGIPHDFHTADVCALPFKDGAFDAAYCAHMIYHITDVGAQDAAIAELLRVVRPGGVVVLVTANPFPLLFPIRIARRFAAGAALIGPILNRLRPKPPLPYKPMPIGWIRRRLARGGPVEVLSGGIPSNGFYRNVTEFKGAGKLLWRSIRWLDVNCPKLSAYLGNYVIFSCQKGAISGASK